MTTGTVANSNLTSLYSNTTTFTSGIVNSSVYSVNGGTGVTVDPTTGNVVVSIGQSVATTANPTFAGATLGDIKVGIVNDTTISLANNNQFVRLLQTSTATNIPQNGLRISVESTGTPAAGFGTNLEFEIESAPGVNKQSGLIECVLTDVTSGSEDAKFEISLMSNGVQVPSISPQLTLLNNGNLTITGDLQVSGQQITTGADNSVIIERTSPITSSAPFDLTLRSISTGTPAVGFGSAMLFQGQTTTSNFENAAYISVNSTDITPGSEDFSMYFGLMQNGAVFSDKMVLSSAGNLNIAGFLNISTNQATLSAATLTTTATTTVPLITSTRNAITGLVNIIQGANVHCVNVTVLRVDATTALLTTYGEMFNTISLADFNADVSGGTLRLLVTPSSATSTVFSVVRTSLT